MGNSAQTGKAVFALVDHGGPSYLLAVDKGTGKSLWKADRTGGLSWASPVVCKHGDREVVLVTGRLSAARTRVASAGWNRRSAQADAPTVGRHEPRPPPATSGGGIMC